MTSPSSSTKDFFVTECEYGCRGHIFPVGWILGGPDLSDPRADPRWMPTTYTYYNDKLEVLHVTQTPLCDDQAIDEFTEVSGYGSGYKPVWIAARRPGEEKVAMLPVKYDSVTDTATDLPS